MAKLSDTQAVILTHAAVRDGGSLYPLPDTLRRNGGTMKALAALVKAGWAEEHETSDAALACRQDGDLCFGVFVTPAGLAAIGVVAEGAPLSPVPAPADDQPPSRTTKASTVVALLQREGGATLPELIEATGWLPHTTRAALTGLRKKGHSVLRDTRDGASCYRIVAA